MIIETFSFGREFHYLNVNNVKHFILPMDAEWRMNRISELVRLELVLPGKFSIPSTCLRTLLIGTSSRSTRTIHLEIIRLSGQLAVQIEPVSDRAAIADSNTSLLSYAHFLGAPVDQHLPRDGVEPIADLPQMLPGVAPTWRQSPLSARRREMRIDLPRLHMVLAGAVDMALLIFLA